MPISSLNCPFCGAAIQLHEAPIKECPSCHKPLHTPAGKKADTGIFKLDAVESKSTADSPAHLPKLHFDRLGPYAIVRCIGKGGMGFVYEANDTRLNRRVALKTIETNSQTDDPTVVFRFRKEAQNSAKLRHPHIVSVHDVGRDGGFDYFTMDLVEGVTLDQWLEKTQSTLKQRVQLIEKVARALHYAHEQGVIHRDVKPGNIMIDSMGEPQIMDFGLARNTRDASNVTMNGLIVGTPAYMAPEQSMGTSFEVGAKADIWALGVILYESLIGKPPFDIGTVYQTIYAVLHSEPTPPRKVNPSFPKDLETIIYKCLEKQVEKRYASAEQLANDLRAWLEGRSIEARSLRWWEKWWKKIQQKRAISIDEFVLEQQARQRAEAQKLELQSQVEREEKQEWRLVFEDCFKDSNISDRWEIVGGKWEIKEGELRIWDGEPQIAYLKQPLTSDVRIEFECYQVGDYLCDLSGFIQALPLANRKTACESGYLFQYGGLNNTLSFIEKPRKRLWEKAHSPIIAGERYHIIIEKWGPKLSFWVNDLLVCELQDDDPLLGSERTSVGLYGWKGDTRYVYFKAYQLGIPVKGDLLEIANRQLEKGRLESAIDLYQEVIESSDDPLRIQRARQGIHIVKTKSDLRQNFERYNKQILEQWPKAKLQLTDKGLILDMSDLGIKDLSPLTGIPLHELNCSGNEIRDLTPLKGMALTHLNINTNRIQSLEPIRGMPLHTLSASNNDISNLEPLADSKLETLLIGRNPAIQNYEVLKNVPLRLLNCSSNKIRDLGFLRDMSINRFTCNYNLITDLSPLQKLPLGVVHLGCNLIADLEPLRGKALKNLTIEQNQIASLEPLRGIKLSQLQCQNNLLKSLDPFVDDPPKVFLFDGNPLTADEWDRVASIWSQHPWGSTHALHARILKFILLKDFSKLREFATPFEDVFYLLIPLHVKWREAESLSRTFGGRLLNLQHESDTQFVKSINMFLPTNSWIGSLKLKNNEIYTIEKNKELTLKDEEIQAFGAWNKGSSWGQGSLSYYNDFNCAFPFFVRWDA